MAKKKSSQEKEIENLIKLVLEFRLLKYIPRACLPYLKNIVSENIAEHTFYTVIFAWILGKTEKEVNQEKIIKMALIHDLPEVRGGDKNLINKFYSQPLNELRIMEDVVKDYQLKDLEFLKLLKEFKKEKTKESKIVRDADILAQMLVEKESIDMGNFKAKRWLSTSLKRLKTKNAKRLGKALYEIDTDKWWLEIVKKYILKTEFLSSQDPFFHLP